MSLPIVEQIAWNIFKTVSETQPASGANFTYVPVRPTAEWPAMATGLVIIMQEGKPLQHSLNDTPAGFVRWLWPFTLTAIVVPDETLTEPVDRLRNQMFADLANSLLADTSRGGLAIDTLIDEPEFYDAPSGYWAVEMRIMVDFRTAYHNYYSQAPTTTN